MTAFNFFLKPWVVAMGWFATVIGAVSGFYFYQQSKASRELTFALISPFQTIQAGPSSKLAVTYEGRALENGVLILQLALWNAGKLAIHAADVTKPIVLVTGEQRPILEAKIQANTQQDVLGVSLDEHELAQGRVGVNWKILEQCDGVRLQLLIVNGPGARLSVEGAVEGQRQIVQSSGPRRRSAQEVVSSCFSIFLAGLVCFAEARARASRSAHGETQTKRDRRSSQILLIFAAVMFVAGVLGLLPLSSAPPEVLFASP